MEIILQAKARERGLIKYYTGESCPKGHLSPRYVSSRECVMCLKIKHKENRESKIEHYKMVSRAWKKNNPTKNKQITEEWRKDNYTHIQDYSKEYGKTHQAERTAIQNARYAKQKKTTAAWANKTDIDAIYAEANRLTKLAGIKYSIDHIIPQTGKFVTGLHVEYNLQIMPKNKNTSKYNKYDPLNPTKYETGIFLIQIGEKYYRNPKPKGGK